MRFLGTRKFLKAILTITLMGFALMSFALTGGLGLGVAEAQNEPNAPSPSLFLPNITSHESSEQAELVYDFTVDSESELPWNELVKVFEQFGTTLIRAGAALDLSEEHHGMRHSVATIRCIGADCPVDTTAQDEIPAHGGTVVENITLRVRLDESRALEFRPLSKNRIELGLMVDEVITSKVRFTCRDCTIEVTINDQFIEPVPTSTSKSPATSTAIAPTVVATDAPSATVAPSPGGGSATPTNTGMPGGSQTPTATPVPTSSGPDHVAPVIAGVKVERSTTSAIIKWTTNEPATSSVVFGQSASYGRGPVGSSQLTTEHAVTLSGLSADTLYHYQITSTDANGNVATTANATFTTSVPGGAGGSVFVETFDGDPSSPQPWTSENWDITVHSRDRETHATLQGMHAHHGGHCEPPMATHHISAYQDAVFQCRNHMMTAINASGYGLIYLTPAYQVDFTEGTATIRFDMSTLRTSHRDWVDLYISPMGDHLQLALDDWLPDLSGEPKDAIKIKMDVVNGKTPFRAYVVKDHNPHEIDSKWWVSYEDYLEPSASTRTTFELQISRTHIKFGIPEYNLWWVDSDIEPLDWSVGVVQIGHHSYNPTKDCFIVGGCSPNTWHWDNVMIDPARPFTMIHATQRHVDAASGASVRFESPAPANAYLRFAGIGKNMEVSFDDGKSWEAARVQPQVRHSEEAFWSYFTPIPAGVDQVKFRAQNWWGGNWLVRDLTIWAE